MKQVRPHPALQPLSGVGLELDGIGHGLRDFRCRERPATAPEGVEGVTVVAYTRLDIAHASRRPTSHSSGSVRARSRAEGSTRAISLAAMVWDARAFKWP